MNHTEFSDGYMLAAILQSDGFVNAIQRELKQVYPQDEVSPALIRRLLRDVVFSNEVRDPGCLALAEAKLNQRPRRLTRSTGTFRAVEGEAEVDSNEEVRIILWHDKTLSTRGG